MPKVTRVYADSSGETYLAPVELPEQRAADGSVASRTLRDIPITTLDMGQLFRRQPPVDLHPAPRRQFVVVLRGAFEVTTTGGECERFEAGDCLLADDVDGKGHLFADVGEEPLSTLRIGVSPDWKCPGS
jgi:hypothetical protein